MIRLTVVVSLSFLSCRPELSADAPDEITLEDGKILAATAAALTEFVKSGSYAGWRAEPASHASAGPHGGRVRTFVNAALHGSLSVGSAEHPAGSVAVKELFDGDGELSGHALELKGPTSGWIFFEGFADDEYAEPYYLVGTDNLCGDCHAKGADFVLTPVVSFQ